jgi:nucleoside 2-deoxyribosyltransferase
MRSTLKSQTVYISGPITNNIEHPAHFVEAKSWLKNEGHRVLSPLDIAPPPSNDSSAASHNMWKDSQQEKSETWCYYMKEAIQMLTKADCIYMLEGWEASKGARLEFYLATELNIPVHYAYEDYKYV